MLKAGGWPPTSYRAVRSIAPIKPGVGLRSGKRTAAIIFNHNKTLMFKLKQDHHLIQKMEYFDYNRPKTICPLFWFALFYYLFWPLHQFAELHARVFRLDYSSRRSVFPFPFAIFVGFMLIGVWLLWGALLGLAILNYAVVLPIIGATLAGAGLMFGLHVAVTRLKGRYKSPKQPSILKQIWQEFKNKTCTRIEYYD